MLLHLCILWVNLGVQIEFRLRADIYFLSGEYKLLYIFSKDFARPQSAKACTGQNWPWFPGPIYQNQFTSTVPELMSSSPPWVSIRVVYVDCKNSWFSLTFEFCFYWQARPLTCLSGYNINKNGEFHLFLVMKYGKFFAK